MEGRGGGKRRPAWLRCFSRPVGDSHSGDSDERWEARSKVNNSKLGAKKAIFKGEQGPPSLSRDSQNRLEAYLGRGQQHPHGASDSVGAQAAPVTATEHKSKDLSEDHAPCSSNALNGSSTLQGDVVGSSSSAGAARSPIKAARTESARPQTPQESDSDLLKENTELGTAGSFVPCARSEHHLQAAPGAVSKLLNRVSLAITPPDESETSKTNLHDASPTITTNSDQDSQDSVLQLAERPPSTGVAAPSYQPSHLRITTPFENTAAFSTSHHHHAIRSSRSSHSLASVADSLFPSEGSIKLGEANAPAPLYHSTIRTIALTLSSSSITHNVAVDSILLSSAAQPPQQEQRSNHQRAKTMPHLHSTMSKQHEFSSLQDDHSSVDGVSVKSTQSQHTRRHTAIVLLSHKSEDEEEEEEEEKVEAAPFPATAGDVASSLVGSSTNSRGSKTRRRLSEVYEGHHIPLQKLRKQMGNPEDHPGDLLSLMARRVFSQQNIMSRVNSEGLISVLAHSSFKTPSTHEQRLSERVENPDWLETRISSLPRIRTHIEGTSSAHSAAMI